MPSDTGHRRASRTIRIVLGGVFLVAVVIRLPALTSGELPNVSHPDEPITANVAHDMARRSSLLTDWYTYPSALFIMGAAVLKVSGADESERMVDSKTMGVSRTDHQRAMVALRLISFLAGIAAAAAAGFAIRSLTSSETAGAVGALAVWLSPMYVRHSVLYTPDMLASSATMAALTCAVLWYRRRTWQLLISSGLLAGLAVGSKYNTAVVVIGVLVAVALVPEPWRTRARLAVSVCLAAAVAFLATTPGVIFRWEDFSSGLEGIRSHYESGHFGAVGAVLAFNSSQLVWGLGLFALGSAAVFVTGFPVRRSAPLLTFALLYFVLVSLASVRFERNLLPLVAPMVSLAVVGATVLLARSSWSHRRTMTAGVLLTAATLSLVPGWIRWSDGLYGDDRADARRYLEETLPPDETVIAESYSPLLDLPNVRYHPFLLSLGHPASADLIVINSKGSGRSDTPAAPEADTDALNQLRAEFCLVDRFGDDSYWVEVRRRCE